MVTWFASWKAVELSWSLQGFGYRDVAGFDIAQSIKNEYEDKEEFAHESALEL